MDVSWEKYFTNAKLTVCWKPCGNCSASPLHKFPKHEWHKPLSLLGIWMGVPLFCGRAKQKQFILCIDEGMFELIYLVSLLAKGTGKLPLWFHWKENWCPGLIAVLELQSWIRMTEQCIIWPKTGIYRLSGFLVFVPPPLWPAVPSLTKKEQRKFSVYTCPTMDKQRTSFFGFIQESAVGKGSQWRKPRRRCHCRAKSRKSCLHNKLRPWGRKGKQRFRGDSSLLSEYECQATICAMHEFTLRKVLLPSL